MYYVKSIEIETRYVGARYIRFDSIFVFCDWNCVDGEIFRVQSIHGSRTEYGIDIFPGGFYHRR